MPLSVLLVALAVGYSVGLGRLYVRSASRSWLLKRACCWAAALMSLWVALESPLASHADMLLTVHMLQHLTLMLWAAPLLVLARPSGVLLWSMPRGARAGLGRAWNKERHARVICHFRKPLLPWIAFCGSMVLWHIPAVFRWAQGMQARQIVMHASLFAASWLFWSVVLGGPSSGRFSSVGKALYVFTAAFITGLPGALIAFAPRPLYCSVPAAPVRFGLTPLADQQLAGLVMWIPMDLMLFSVSLVLFAAALSRGSHDSRARSDAWYRGLRAPIGCGS